MESSHMPINSESEESFTQFETHDQLQQYLADQKAINSSSSEDEQVQEDDMYSSNWGTKAKAYYEKDNLTKKLSRAEQERIEQQTLSEALQKKKTIENLVSENKFEDPDLADSDSESEKNEEVDAKIISDTSKLEKYYNFHNILAENLEITTSRLENTESLPDILLEFLDLKKMLTLDFMSAITIYLYLYSSLTDAEIEAHPINSRLLKYEKIFKSYEKSGEDFQILDEMAEQVCTIDTDHSEPENEEDIHENEEEKTVEDYELYLHELKIKRKKREEKKEKAKKKENIEEQSDEENKRKITREMEKNKGHVVSKKKKIDRNPRVKHREKFRKFQEKRKGQVKKVRSKEHRYEGEYSGINKAVIASRKIV